MADEDEEFGELTVAGHKVVDEAAELPEEKRGLFIAAAVEHLLPATTPHLEEWGDVELATEAITVLWQMNEGLEPDRDPAGLVAECHESEPDLQDFGDAGAVTYYLIALQNALDPPAGDARTVVSSAIQALHMAIDYLDPDPEAVRSEEIDYQRRLLAALRDEAAPSRRELVAL